MAGIAFGIDDDESIYWRHFGFEQLIYTNSSASAPKIVASKSFLVATDRMHLPGYLTDFEAQALTGMNQKPKCSFGLILSGEKLVDNIDFRDQLLEIEPEAIGGEMEGSGLYAACQNAKVDWILVKSICDWADGRKKSSDSDTNQRNAAHNAASFVLHALKMAPLKQEGKKREPNSSAPLDRNANAGISTVWNGPRMDAYSKFMELMSVRPIDGALRTI